MRGPTEVLVVDDSELFVAALVEILAIDPAVHVVGTARTGAEAIEMAKRIRPHVILMDVHMPTLSGIDATEEIMNACPTPILLMTSGYDGSAATVAFTALQSGALDVVDKPQWSPWDEGQARALVEHVKLLASVPVISHVRAKLKAPLQQHAAADRCEREAGGRKLVAIAASTGGPAALGAILSRLPADFAAPVLIVQHMIPDFTPAFVSWLDSTSPLRVRLARDNERVEPGTALVAPDGVHLTVAASGRVRLFSASQPTLHCPSADVLFASVARAYGAQAVGLLLTGMGRDGAEGLAEMRRSGALTIAQDASSSVVDGMPRAARELDAAAVVASPLEIPRLLARAVMRQQGRATGSRVP